MSEVIIINSANRLSGNSANFAIDIMYDELQNYNRCSLVKLTMPKSYYLIDSTLLEDRFTLKINAWTYTVIIDEGNVNRDDFRTVLETALNTALDAVGCPVTDVNALWRVNYGGASNIGSSSYASELTLVNRYMDDGKYIFSLHATDVGLTVQIITNELDIPAKCLGLSESSTTTFTEATPIATHLYYAFSTKPVNFEKYEVMFLRSNIIGELYNHNLSEIYTQGSNYYANIIIENNNFRQISRKFNNGIKHMTISIVDKDDRIIDLNGTDVIFSILLYREDEIYKKIDAIGNLLGEYIPVAIESDYWSL